MEAGRRAGFYPLILTHPLPMKKLSLWIFALFCLSACSKQAWLAKIYMVKAEEAFSKAHAMRVKKNEASYGKRLKYYKIACDNFAKAYRWNRGAFTLNRIDEASETCLRVEDLKNEQMFRQFEEEYAQNHPDEAKYGDAGAYMNLES